MFIFFELADQQSSTNEILRTIRISKNARSLFSLQKTLIFNPDFLILGRLLLYIPMLFKEFNPVLYTYKVPILHNSYENLSVIFHTKRNKFQNQRIIPIPVKNFCKTP